PSSRRRNARICRAPGCCDGAMRSADIGELQRHASAVVAEVAAGQIVTITDRGRAVARLVPIGSRPVDDLIDAGRACPPSRRLSDLGSAPPRARGSLDLSRLVTELRSGERW